MRKFTLPFPKDTNFPIHLPLPKFANSIKVFMASSRPTDNGTLNDLIL